MKSIKRYSEFNEEINFKKALVGGALATSLVAGSGCSIEKPEVSSIETVSEEGQKFEYFELTTKNLEDIQVYVSKNGIIGSNWTIHRGKNNSSYTTISVPKGTKRIYYNIKFWSGDMVADVEKISNDYIDINELEIDETGNGGVVKVYKGFWNDIYILEYDSIKNEDNKFVVNGKEYTYLIIERNNFFGRNNYFIVPNAKSDW